MKKILVHLMFFLENSFDEEITETEWHGLRTISLKVVEGLDFASENGIIGEKNSVTWDADKACAWSAGQVSAWRL